MNRVLKRFLLLTFLGLTACAHMPGQTVWSDDNWTLFQEGTGPFQYANHYIDQRTGVVLTIYELNPGVSNFVPNFRGVPTTNLPFKDDRHGPWQIEYFCEPDYMLGFYSDAQKTVAYLNSLHWEKSLYFDQDKDRILLSYRHRAAEGWLSGSTVYDHVKNQTPPPVDMLIHFMWTAGSNVVIVQLDITNQSAARADLSMVLQDAAYMWFPDGNQRNVGSGLWQDGAFLSKNRKVAITKNDGKLAPILASTWSTVHGVVSGFRHVRSIDPVGQPAAIEAGGIAPGYVMVPRYVPVGHQLPLDKDQGHDLASVLDKIHRVSTPPEKPFYNRYLAYQFQNVRPGEKVTIRYDLIMGIGSPANMAGSITKLIHERAKR